MRQLVSNAVSCLFRRGRSNTYFIGGITFWRLHRILRMKRNMIYVPVVIVFTDFDVKHTVIVKGVYTIPRTDIWCITMRGREMNLIVVLCTFVLKGNTHILLQLCKHPHIVVWLYLNIAGVDGQYVFLDSCLENILSSISIVIVVMHGLSQYCQFLPHHPRHTTYCN